MNAGGFVVIDFSLQQSDMITSETLRVFSLKKQSSFSLKKLVFDIHPLTMTLAVSSNAAK